MVREYRLVDNRSTETQAASAIVSLFDTPGGVVFSYLVIIKSITHPRTAEASGIFTTAEKKILENCRCIVPNFMND